MGGINNSLETMKTYSENEGKLQVTNGFTVCIMGKTTEIQYQR